LEIAKKKKKELFVKSREVTVCEREEECDTALREGIKVPFLSLQSIQSENR